MPKSVFEHMRTAKALINLRNSGEQMPGRYFAHTCDESESMHFARARRHIWRGPSDALFIYSEQKAKIHINYILNLTYCICSVECSPGYFSCIILPYVIGFAC